MGQTCARPLKQCVCICPAQDGVFRMSLSPDGTLLAVIHFSGRLSLWDVPSLKQRATWGQEQQVRLPAFGDLVRCALMCVLH